MLLAKDELAADQLDTLLQDEEFEIIVGSKTCDVTTLIQDEVIVSSSIFTTFGQTSCLGESGRANNASSSINRRNVTCFTTNDNFKFLIL